MTTVCSLEEIRSLIGEPRAYTAMKINPCLHAGMADFIAQSRLAFISSVDVNGFPTIAPRGDEAGFVKVKDDRTLLIPERIKAISLLSRYKIF